MSPDSVDKNNSVLVAGAGIAGMAAATHLAELGIHVRLLDSNPSIGGSMHLLDHTFPTNSCGICLMLPHQPALCPTFECERQPNIELLTYAELLDLDGQPGDLTATIRLKPRYVDPEKCDGCGACATVCPESRLHDYEGALAPTRAIYRPPGLRAVPDAWLIDMQACTRCGECVQACPTAAIDLDMQPRTESFSTGALLLTPGFAAFDARLKGEYGYRVYDNVLSSLEFERMVSLAGSSVAHLARPSDNLPPKRMAFVHCVGSRDNLCGAGHCSSACCMYTAKQVALAKSLDPDLEVTVFFMDIRAFGKDFEAYFDAVRSLPGVSYKRAMPSSVRQLQQSRDLLLTFAGDNGGLQEQAFDLLVLSLGFAPPQGMRDLAQGLGLDLNDYGFAVSDAYAPARTNIPGVFVAGAFREPKDIPETVAEAAAAAGQVAAFLHASASAPLEKAPPVALRDVSEEEPKLGVFCCQCNGDLDPLDTDGLAAWAEGLPGVALARTVPMGCTPEGQAFIQATVQQAQLNRVVAAGCSHRLFAGEFDNLMADAGLDPRLLARVNLREQVVFPHAALPQAAERRGGNPTSAPAGAGKGNDDLTAKAQSLVAMAAASLKAMAGVDALNLGGRQVLTRQALVLGGGAAGLSAALQLADLGIPTHLVERDVQLGGQWRHIRFQADGSDPAAALEELIRRVEAQPAITLHLGTELLGSEGGPGHYRSTISSGDDQESLDHGVLVVATGGQPAAIDEYLYDRDPRVLTQRQLEQQMADGTLATANRLVMIQCAGSREPQRPYCSRVCCTQAVKNALRLKELRPGLDIYILYREVRTYGFREAYYQAARDAGVVFVRYELPELPGGTKKPVVQASGNRLQVTVSDPISGQSLILDADLLVLSTGIEPHDQALLAQRLDLDLDEGGFFREQHAKMKPLDLNKAGVFVAGLAHSPRFLDETIAQAQGAAMRAAAFLAPGEVSERPTSVWVNARLCSFCGLCVEACPFEARVMNYDSRVADVDYALCQGCGLCAMVCPNKATLQKTFEHKQLMSAIDMALV